MNFQQAKDQILVGLCGIAVCIFAWIAMSVTELNQNVATVVAIVGQHETRILNLEGKSK